MRLSVVSLCDKIACTLCVCVKPDQDLYDFDPNPDDDIALCEADMQQNTPYITCIKV